MGSPKVIYCDTKDLEKDIKNIEKYLTGRSIHAAMASALNRTLTFVGAETKRQVNSEYAVRKSINKSLTEKKATSSNLVAIANYQDKPLPLFVFKHKIPANEYRSPILDITIKKGASHTTGYTTNGGKQIALFGAYGNKLVRRDLGQRKLKTAYSISIPQMVRSKEVYDVIAKKAEAKLIERMNHEINWRISKL